MHNKVPLFPARNDDDSIIPDRWRSVDGYRVALCRLKRLQWTVTRPNEEEPFLFTGSQADVHLQIRADRKASEVAQ